MRGYLADGSRMKLSKTEGSFLNVLFMLIVGIISGWLVMEKYFIQSIIVCVVGIIFILGFNIYRTRSKDKTKKIEDISNQESNDPDLFPDPVLFPSLNKSALKYYINRAIRNYPFNSIIKKIDLYLCGEGPSYKYCLIVTAPKNHRNYENIVKFWDEKKPSSIFDEGIKEIYKDSTDRELFIAVVAPDMEINGIVDLDSRCNLYRMNILNKIKYLFNVSK